MPHYVSIKKRLFLAVLVLLLAAMVPPGLYAWYKLKTEVRADAEQMTLSILRGVEWTLDEHAPFKDTLELDSWMKNYQKNTGIRLSYIVGGALLADSELPYAQLASTSDHSMRPEVRNALQSGFAADMRMSASVGKAFIYSAISMNKVPGLAPGILRLAMPDFKVAHMVRSIGLDLGLSFAAAFALGLGMLWMLLFRGFQFLDETVQTAQAIGNGDYKRRMPQMRYRELRPFAAAIDAMSHNIEMNMEAVREEKSHLEAVLGAMREGVLVLDSLARVILRNPAAAGFFPALRDPKNGGAGQSLMEATMHAALHEAVQKSLSSPSTPVESPLLNLEGDRICLARIIPLQTWGNGRLMLVLTDVSDREKLDKIRRDFVANVSHELRTPITSIRGYAESLLDNPDLPPEKSRAFLEVILRNSSHMARMIEGLLTLARTEHAARQTKLGPVDCRRILDQILDEAMLLPGSPKTEIINHLPAGPLNALAEADGLREVFRNLLENAVKYGNGKVDVSDASDRKQIHIRFRDYGPGIQPANLDRIFERFYRLKLPQPTPQPHSDGAGLGLAICRHILRNFKGDIHAFPPADHGPGVVFEVILNRAD